jgi:hypothetical protein
VTMLLVLARTDWDRQAQRAKELTRTTTTGIDDDDDNQEDERLDAKIQDFSISLDNY